MTILFLYYNADHYDWLVLNYCLHLYGNYQIEIGDWGSFKRLPKGQKEPNKTW